MSGSDGNGLPDTERHPAFLSPYDTQIFNEAGITPLSVLRNTFATDYAGLIADAKRRDAALDHNEWRIVSNKMEIGGRITRAKEMKAHGGKGDVARDIGKHEDTCTRYEKLYKYGPWAAPIVRAEAAAARAKGEDYNYSIERIIKIGTEESIRRGATEAAKPKFTGVGKVLMIDPMAKTVDLADLPTSFANAKRKTAHYWMEDTSIKLPTGVQAWTEVNGEAKGYFSYDFPDPVGKHFYTDTRVMLTRISKDDVVLDLGITNMEDWLTAADFYTRSPKKVSVFDIDPESGAVNRDNDVNDDDFLVKGDAIETSLTGILEGFTLVQDEPNSIWLYKLMDKEYAGRSLIVRFSPDSRWLEPLATNVSAGDLKQHVSFTALDAMNKLRRVEPNIDPNEGFEPLDETMAMDYFRCDMATIDAYALREWGEGDGKAHLRQHDMLREIANLDDKEHPVTLIYNIARIRDIITKWRELDAGKERLKAEAKTEAEAKAAEAEAEANAFEADDKGNLHFTDETTTQGSVLESTADLTSQPQYRREPTAEHPPAFAAVEGGFGSGPALPPAEPPAVPASEPEQPVAKPVVETTGEEVEPTKEPVVAAELQPVSETPVTKPPVEAERVEDEPEAVDEEINDEVAEPITEPVQAEPEEVEPHIVSYAQLPYGERDLTDRKLRDEMAGLIRQADRTALQTLNRVLGPNKALLGGSADLQRERVRELADTLDKVLSVVRKIEPLIAETFDRLDVAKAERAPRFDEVIAFYANTRQGDRRILWEKPEGEAKIDVTAYIVRTAAKGEITLPTDSDGDQPSLH